MNVAVHPKPETSVNVISLCTGGGGLDLGLELALPTARSVVMVEREAFSVAHLVAAIEQGLLAPAAIWSDVRTFDGRPWRGLVDGLIGGIPCQPHSLAGKKRGSLDERDLWSPTRRIIATARPWFVWIENVRGMLSAGADDVAGAQRVLGDLRRLGFSVECGLFTAAETGASHLRPRVFILGVADAIGHADWRADFARSIRSAESEAEGEARKSNRERGGSGLGDGSKDVADAGSTGPQGREFGRPLGQRHGAAAPRSAPELREVSLADAPGVGWGEGRAEPEGQRRQHGANGASLQLVEPDDSRQQGIVGRPGAEEFASERSLSALVDTDDGAFEIGQGDAIVDGRRSIQSASDRPAGFELSLYPPGPADLDGWRRVLAHSPDLEPSVRRMADGLAARLDLSGPHAARVDRLRMLGNGVVSLEAAYAFRTLVSRLAATGHAGAAELARLMEAA